MNTALLGSLFQRLFIILFLLLLGVSGSANAETPVYRIYDVRDGFNAHIYNVVQDKDGVIWLSQDGGGILAFSSLGTKHFTTREGLPSNSNNNIIYSKNGRLWVSMSDGPPIWQESDSTKGWTATSGHGFLGSNYIMETISGDILIATKNGVLVLKDNEWKPWKVFDEEYHRFTFLFQDSRGLIFGVENQGILWQLHPGEPKRLFSDDQNFERQMRLFEDGNGRILVTGHSQGLKELTFTGELVEAQPEASQLPSDMVINTVHASRNGDLFLGSWGSGVLLFKNGKLIQKLDKRYGLPSVHIESIFEDREGNLFITGIGGGLYVMINSEKSQFRNITHSDGLMGDIVWGSLRDSTGSLKVLSHGNLLTTFDKNHTTSQLDLKKIGIGGTMLGLRQFEPDSFWVYGIGGAFQLNRENKLIHHLAPCEGFISQNIRCLHQTQDKSLYLCTSDHGLVKVSEDGTTRSFSRETGFTDSVLALTPISDGRFALATDNGIGFLDPSTGKTTLIDRYKNLAVNGLSDVAQDTEGRIWFASSRGVFRYEDGKIHLFTTRDGLPNDNVYLVVSDLLGAIWVGTANGVARISANDSVSEFGFDDGMINPETNGNSGYLDRDGTIWFGTPTGLSGIQPANLRIDSEPPNIIVFDIQVNDRQPENFSRYVLPNQPYQLELPHDKNNITISLTSIDIARPDSLRFQTRLVGADVNWSTPSSMRFIQYRSLPPGDYRFEAKACKVDGICTTKPAQIHIAIIPPFHDTLVFKISFAVFLLGLAFVLYRLRVRALLHRRQQLEKAVEDRTREVREMSLRDSLTNLRNRRYIHESMVDRFQISSSHLQNNRRMSKTTFGLLMVDIDLFKHVNDSYGHDSGDMVLRQFAGLLEESVRHEDIVCRWGGEEFLLVLSNPNMAILKMLAERIRQRVERHSFDITGNRTIHLTCSLGVVMMPFLRDPVDGDCCWESVRMLADQALYRAKALGRNRWCLLQEGSNTPKKNGIERMLTDLDWAIKQKYVKTIDSDMENESSSKNT